MFMTKKHLSRRTLLRGAGAAIALPLLDSMIPARDGARADGRCAEEPARLHLHSARRDDGQVDAGHDGRALRAVRDLGAARAVQRSALRRQRARARAGRAVDRRRHRRRREPRARRRRVLERRPPREGRSRRSSGRASIRSRPRTSAKTRRCRPIELSLEEVGLNCDAEISPAPTATRWRGSPRRCRCRWRTTRRSRSSASSATAAPTPSAPRGAPRRAACSIR